MFAKRRCKLSLNIPTFCSDFKLVAFRAECDGAEINKDYFHNIEECAEACRGKSEMFIFGTNEYGSIRCKNKVCSCFCEDDTSNFKCNKQKGHNGYNLYAFQGTLITSYISII